MAVGDVLELAVMLSIKLKDEELFERNFLQLKTYYVDLRYMSVKHRFAPSFSARAPVILRFVFRLQSY